MASSAIDITELEGYSEIAREPFIAFTSALQHMRDSNDAIVNLIVEYTEANSDSEEFKTAIATAIRTEDVNILTRYTSATANLIGISTKESYDNLINQINVLYEVCKEAFQNMTLTYGASYTEIMINYIKYFKIQENEEQLATLKQSILNAINGKSKAKIDSVIASTIGSLNLDSAQKMHIDIYMDTFRTFWNLPLPTFELGDPDVMEGGTVAEQILEIDIAGTKLGQMRTTLSTLTNAIRKIKKEIRQYVLTYVYSNVEDSIIENVIEATIDQLENESSADYAILKSTLLTQMGKVEDTNKYSDLELFYTQVDAYIVEYDEACAKALTTYVAYLAGVVSVYLESKTMYTSDDRERFKKEIVDGCLNYTKAEQMYYYVKSYVADKLIYLSTLEIAELQSTLYKLARAYLGPIDIDNEKQEAIVNIQSFLNNAYADAALKKSTAESLLSLLEPYAELETPDEEELEELITLGDLPIDNPASEWDFSSISEYASEIQLVRGLVNGEDIEDNLYIWVRSRDKKRFGRKMGQWISVKVEQKVSQNIQNSTQEEFTLITVRASMSKRYPMSLLFTRSNRTTGEFIIHEYGDVQNRESARVDKLNAKKKTRFDDINLSLDVTTGKDTQDGFDVGRTFQKYVYALKRLKYEMVSTPESELIVSDDVNID